MKTFRLGTRGSELALTQSQMVADKLTELGLTVELVRVKTEGDVNATSLSRLGGVGVFAAQLRLALLNGECDFAVHSFKDLPTAPVLGLCIGAVDQRELPADVLCARQGLTLDQLPAQARIGTGSPRRAAQLKELRPDLETVDIRGNIGTRLGRVEGLIPGGVGDLDAVVLAQSGLVRLGREDVISDHLSQLLPAPAQGALAIETRSEVIFGEQDPLLREALLSLDHLPTRLCVQAERAVLAGLAAGCAAPVGALATFVSTASGKQLQLTAKVISPSGKRAVRRDARKDFSVAELGGGDTFAGRTVLAEAAWGVGLDLATQLLDAGAAKIADLHAVKPHGRGDEDTMQLWGGHSGPEAPGANISALGNGVLPAPSELSTVVKKVAGDSSAGMNFRKDPRES